MLSLVYGSRAVLALIVAGVLCADAPPAELLGRWRSLETSKGGIGAMLTFQANGVVDFSPGAVVETKYRIEGDELILPPATTTGPEQRQKMTFSGPDRLRLDEMALTRKGTAPDPGNFILGEWVRKLDRNGRQMESHFLVYPAGKCLLLLPFMTNAGKYSIEGSTMRLELPGREAAEGKFQIEGDVLTMPGPNGSQTRFQRY